MDDEEEEQSSFKVTDHRMFTTEGEIREQQQPEQGEQAPPQKEEPPKTSPEEKPEASQEPDQKEEAEPTAEQDPSQGVNFASEGRALKEVPLEEMEAFWQDSKQSERRT